MVEVVVEGAAGNYGPRLQFSGHSREAGGVAVGVFGESFELFSKSWGNTLADSARTSSRVVFLVSS